MYFKWRKHQTWRKFLRMHIIGLFRLHCFNESSGFELEELTHGLGSIGARCSLRNCSMVATWYSSCFLKSYISIKGNRSNDLFHQSQFGGELKLQIRIPYLTVEVSKNHQENWDLQKHQYQFLSASWVQSQTYMCNENYLVQ